MRIFIANNAPNLANELARYESFATVEAEFGDDVVEGKGWPTLAHHGPREGQPAPCLGPNLADRPFCPLGTPPEHGAHCIETQENGYCSTECLRGCHVVGVSHFDLDTLGGVMRLAGRKAMTPESGEPLFWEIAARVDVMGVHKLRDIRNGVAAAATAGVSLSGWDAFEPVSSAFQAEWDATINRLNAFWAWSEKNRLFPPRDGSVSDVSDFFEMAMDVVDLILDDDPAMIAAGKNWAAAKDELNRLSFHEAHGPVVLRQAKEFVNHLYDHPNGRKPFLAVVGFNPERESITISLADPISGFSVAEFVQELWGPEAGGRDVIGGSPRGYTMSLADAKRAAAVLRRDLDRID